MIVNVVNNVDNSKKNQHVRCWILIRIAGLKRNLSLKVFYLCLMKKRYKVLDMHDHVNIPLIETTKKVHVRVMIF
jgi:hypothetical protein